LVPSIHDSAEDGVRKMIESSQRMIIRNSQRKGGGINPAIRRHLELQIKTLQNAHRRDVDKSRQLLQVKEREKQHETIHIEDRQTDRQTDTQGLVTEIEMFKGVLHLVARDRRT
jgi:hypothetical protein